MSFEKMKAPDSIHGDIDAKIASYDWQTITNSLNTTGWAILPGALQSWECNLISGLYNMDEGFRSRVIMARHGFGKGEYKYYSYPLPSLISRMRTAIYPHLVPVANRWNELMKIDVRYPQEHNKFIETCHAAGQVRPTPLLLKYGPDDYNCLHQDLYGEHVFPMQVVFLLSEPNKDFTGGELILTEQRPRMQTRAEVLPLKKGDAAIFSVHHRPHQGTKGYYRVNMRHGVSRVREGNRYTTGIIFHDAT